MTLSTLLHLLPKRTRTIQYVGGPFGGEVLTARRPLLWMNREKDGAIHRYVLIGDTYRYLGPMRRRKQIDCGGSNGR